MKPSLLLFASYLIAGGAFATSTALAADESGWTDLLTDGDLAAHWTTTGSWTLKDGVASLAPPPGNTAANRWSAYLWSKEKYGDFEIEFDYRLEKDGNSGFYFRVGDTNDPVAQGIEVQIFDSAGQTKLTDHSSGGVIPKIPPTKEAAKPAGEWNHFHITNKGNKVTVKLNDVIVNEVDLSKKPFSTRPATGPIGFQDHGMPLSLRNIKIRKL